MKILDWRKRINFKSVLVTVTVTIALTIPGAVFIPDVVISNDQSPREFAAYFIEEWNASNHGNICESIAVETLGGTVETCTYEAIVSQSIAIYTNPKNWPVLSQRLERHAKVVELAHNVYSVPITDQLNQLGYIDIQRDKDGEWKALQLRTI